MVSLDNADVMTMKIQSKAVELLEHARHATVAGDQSVSQEMLVNSGIGEVATKSLVVKGVVAQRRRIRVQIGISQVEVEILLRPPHLYDTRHAAYTQCICKRYRRKVLYVFIKHYAIYKYELKKN